ncbi:CPCC family cysteine-rich protein [Pelagibius sp. CAU 1746]|uniref:CPCC family cysteine-rich protein n=1 Tax=Pelagibius sp. CAU 1746 TaxID=3140370 RepID=UPI00345F97C9
MVFPCPCCGYLTFSSPPPGTFEICPVCYWEDDPIQSSNPNYAGGANTISLETAKKNFAHFGAVKAEFRKLTRPPAAEEMP